MREGLVIKRGQQTGSKRRKSAWLNHATSNREKPERPHQ
jgi:hypothetical protein